MKKIISAFAFQTVLAFGLIHFNYSSSPKNNFVKGDGEEMEDGYVKQIHAKYANPTTGKIPSMGLMKAWNELTLRGLMPSPYSFSSNHDRSNAWSPVNDFFASIAVTKMCYDPQNTQTFYFCTGEGWYNADASVGTGVWKSTDGGANWSQLASSNNVKFQYCQDIAVHPTTGAVYVCTRNNGLMRSTDGGNTFHKLLGAGAGYGFNTNTAVDVEFTKNGGVFCTLGIFTNGGIFYSNTGDSGTWIHQTTGFPAFGTNRIEIATAPSNDSVAYAVAQNSAGYTVKGIYKTTDKGLHWDTLPNPGGNHQWAKKQAWYDLAIAVDPHNENVIALGGWGLWRSQDGGNSWMQLSHGKLDSLTYQYVHVDQHEIIFDGSDTVYFGNDGGIWQCTNFTSAFPGIYDRDYGYRVTQFYGLDISQTTGSNIVIGGTQDNGSLNMMSSGISPFTKLSGADGAYSSVNFLNDSLMYTNKNSNGTFRIHDYGVSNTRDTITNRWLTDADVDFINAMAMDVNDPNILYQASHKGLWRLKNANTVHLLDSAWEKCTMNYGDITAIGIAKDTANMVFIGRADGSIGRVAGADTTNATYAPHNCDLGSEMNNGYINCIYVDPANGNHVFCIQTNYGIKNIYETNNALADTVHWKAQDGDLPDLPVNWVFPHPSNANVCYIATDLGCFYTDSLAGDSTHWLPCSNGLANVRVQMFAYRDSDHQLFCTTHGRGMYQTTLSTAGPYNLTWAERGPLNVGGRTQTIMVDPNDPLHHKIWAGSVAGGLWETDDINTVPSVTGINYGIEQPTSSFSVYPNPVGNSGTTISFSSLNEKLSVYIFNAAGEMIQTLASNQYFVKGNNKLMWQPSSLLPNGIYFVMIKGTDRKEVKKVVVVK